jgi:hypothetical protein
VPDQEISKRGRCTLVENDLHLRGRQRTLRGMLQNGANLRWRDALEPLSEVVDRGAALQVFEES